MATSTIDRIPAIKTVTGVQPQSPVSDVVTGLISSYGNVVTVNILFRIAQSPGNTDTILTGFPKSTSDMNITIHKRVGGGNYGVVLTAGGNLRNAWEGINTGEYTASFSYVSNDV